MEIEAVAMADKIVVLNAGRVEQIGTPLELYDRPVNRFVAGFRGIESGVEVVEPTGSETHVVIDSVGEKLVALIRRRLPIVAGDRLSVVFEEGQGHLFDVESGRRLNSDTNQRPGTTA